MRFLPYVCDVLVDHEVLQVVACPPHHPLHHPCASAVRPHTPRRRRRADGTAGRHTHCSLALTVVSLTHSGLSYSRDRGTACGADAYYSLILSLSLSLSLSTIASSSSHHHLFPSLESSFFVYRLFVFISFSFLINSFYYYYWR